MSSQDGQQTKNNQANFPMISNSLHFILPTETKVVFLYAIEFDGDRTRDELSRRQKINYLDTILEKYGIPKECVVYGGDRQVFSSVNLFNYLKTHCVSLHLSEYDTKSENNSPAKDDPIMMAGFKKRPGLVLRRNINDDNIPIINKNQYNFLNSLVAASAKKSKLFKQTGFNTFSRKQEIEGNDTIYENVILKPNHTGSSMYYSMLSIDCFCYRLEKKEKESEDSNKEEGKEAEEEDEEDEEEQIVVNDVQRRFTATTDFLKSIKMEFEGELNEYLFQFDIDIGDPFIDFKQLKIPTLVYGSEEMPCIPPLIPNYPKYVRPAEHFVVYTLYGGMAEEEDVRSCMTRLKEMGQKRGMSMDLRIFKEYKTENEDILMDLRIAEEYKSMHNIDRMLIFAVYGSDHGERLNVEMDLFENGDTLCTQRIGTATIDLILTDHLACMCVLNEMNLRMGGLNYSITPDPIIKDNWISNGDVLVVGYFNENADQYLVDESKRDLKLDVMGYSSNCYKDPMMFSGFFHYQNSVDEHSIQVADHVLQVRFDHIFRMFLKNRKKLPRVLMIQRFDMREKDFRVLRHESDVIESVTRAIYTEYDQEMPKVVLQVISRVGFRVAVKDGNSYSNSTAGTVIDSGLLDTSKQEFYIQSHTCQMGTSRFMSVKTLNNQLHLTTEQLEAYYMALSSVHQITEHTTAFSEPVFIATRMIRAGLAIFFYYRRMESQLVRNANGSIETEELMRKIEQKYVPEDLPPYLRLKHKFMLNSTLHIESF